MRNILFVLLLLQFGYVNGQKLPYNCTLLQKIILRIDTEKKFIPLAQYLADKINFAVDPVSGDYSIIKREGYEHNVTLDSIIKSPDFDKISNAIDDSIFHLSSNNIILDTFHFFTPECNCHLNGKNIFVVNDYRKIPKDKKYNLISVYSLDSYRHYSRSQKRLTDFSTISLRHSSSKTKYDKVIFLYLIEENIPIIYDVNVNHEKDF